MGFSRTAGHIASDLDAELDRFAAAHTSPTLREDGAEAEDPMG